MHILIIGAGLAGMSAAAALARTGGHQITLIDAASAPGQGASFANGGHISAGDAHPWASAESLWHMAVGLFSPARPFRFSPRLDKAQWRFLWRFLQSAAPARRHQAAAHMVELALHSLALLREEKLHPPRALWAAQAHGALHLFTRPGEVEEGWRMAGEAGLKCEKIPAAALGEMEPALAAKRYAGGVFFPGDMTGDARLYLEALAKSLQKPGKDSPGPPVRFLMGSPAIGVISKGRRIVAVRTPAGEISADLVILAAGAASGELARRYFGPEICPALPLFPVIGYSLTAPPGPKPPSMGLLDTAMRVVAAPLGDSVRAAGMADIAGHTPIIRPARTRILRRAVKTMVPGALGGEVEFWAGARPMTPDGLPLLGFAREGGNLLLHTGHGSLGWTLCHATAQMTAALVEGKSPLFDLTPFHPGRFL